MYVILHLPRQEEKAPASSSRGGSSSRSDDDSGRRVMSMTAPPPAGRSISVPACLLFQDCMGRSMLLLGEIDGILINTRQDT